MDNYEPIELRLYSKLPKEERRALWKEYFNIVNPRAKVLFWLNLFIMAGVLISAGFGCYYLIKFAFFLEFSIMIYVFSALVTIGGFASIKISEKVHGGYNKWLEKEKGIIRGQPKKR